MERADNSRCPLCGRPNDCAIAAGSDQPCWCTRIRIDAAVLEQIPPALRGIACVCPACAAKATGGRSDA